MWANTAIRTIARMFCNWGGVGTRGVQLAAPRRRRPHSILNDGVAHDRLDRIHGLRPLRARGLSSLARSFGGSFFFFVASFAVVAPSVADTSTCPSEATAYNKCMTAANGYTDGKGTVGSCVSATSGGNPAYQVKVTYAAGSTWLGSVYPYAACPPPENQCKSHASPSGTIWDSGYVSGSTVCADKCEFVFTQSPGTITVSVTGQPSVGRTSGTFAPTGNTCSGDTTPPPPASQPPQLCSGGSCYDPNSNKFCSVSSSGAQTCVSGPTDPGGGAPPQQPPACSVNGSAASCAGDAGQPPPTPPNPPVTDPQQQQTGSGSFTGSGVGGGITITTGTYQGTSSSSGGTGGNGGTTTPGGSSGGDGSSGGGTGTGDGDGDNGDGTTKCTAGKLCNDAYTGVPCGADPATSGDPLLAQMALEAHRSNCFRQGITDELGTADKSTGKESDLADLTDTDGGNGTVNLDSSGFLGGRGACPGFTPLEFNGYNIMNSDGICETAPMLAAFVLFAAYVAAALIAGRVISGKG